MRTVLAQAVLTTPSMWRELHHRDATWHGAWCLKLLGQLRTITKAQVDQVSVYKVDQDCVFKADQDCVFKVDQDCVFKEDQDCVHNLILRSSATNDFDKKQVEKESHSLSQ